MENRPQMRLRSALLILAIQCQTVPPARGADESLSERVGWQIALERAGFSPGVIDGKVGPKTEHATREFQRARGLSPTGKLDPPTVAALDLPTRETLARYTIAAEDVRRIAPLPKTWLEKSAAKWLGYESVAEAVAERFHCSLGLLAELNPGRSLSALQPGDTVSVPHVVDPPAAAQADRLEIDLAGKTIRVLDRASRTVALFHCSVAAKKSNLPSGEGRVQVISHDPEYLFDPAMWPEVRGIDRKLLIPPGPRNPVGRCWMGLSLPGVGIHGTPHPELIGKTGSHGCIRLTNWDALRLAAMIRVGTKVRFEGPVANGNKTRSR